MKKTTIVLAALLLSTTLAHATLIDVNIGATRNVVKLDQYQQFVVPYAPPVSSINGQTLSLDFMFNDHHSIHLYPGTSRTFDIAAVLQVTVPPGTFQWAGPYETWTVDANGNRNSAIETNTVARFGSGGGGVLNYELGGIFPVLGGPKKPFDFYGLHIDVALPGVDYPVLGGEFIMSPDGFNRENNRFGVGPLGVPDSGSTLMLLGGTVAVVIFLRRRICA